MVTRAFPQPGRLVQAAYRELQIAQFGTDEERVALGRVETLARPWDPPSCAPAVRGQVWAWLEQVAAWVNHEYGWNLERLIPPCWPGHPHLAHELAVLADQRRTAGQAAGSDQLEDWHRYSLPLFLDRMLARLGNHCVTTHDEWPASARHRAFTSDANRRARTAWFADDIPTTRPPAPVAAGEHSRLARLAVVDLATGEVTDPDRPDGGR